MSALRSHSVAAFRQGALSSCSTCDVRPRSVWIGCEDEGRGRFRFRFHRRSLVGAFTLIELLVVIAIAGILAALSVPAFKEFGRSNQQLAATRQVLDAVGRARQLAIANRTTVYMVFLPANYLEQIGYSSLAVADKEQALRLAPNQGRSYALVSLRTVGDQPGQNRPQYLTEWETLPQGWIFDTNKYAGPLTSVIYTNFDGTIMREVSGFELSPLGTAPDALPFPTEDAPSGLFVLPYIAFSHNGGLVSARDEGGEILTLARGTVDPALLANGDYSEEAAFVREFPPGNSQEVPNLIFIDGLTGRSKLEQRRIE